MEYSNLFVCLMGICTVFIGLICIIILVTLMSGVVRKMDHRSKDAEVSGGPTALPQAAASPGKAVLTGNSGSDVTPQLIAAVSAAIAEQMGTDVRGIRIVSIKKI